MASKSGATVIALLCLFTLSIAATDEASNQVTTEPDSDSSAVPLTKLTFRPVNRRFDVRSKRPCRNRLRVHPETRRENEQISYGNDMILASGENPVVHGEGERVQGRLIRLHHHHHHFHHHHHHDEDSDSDDDEDDRTAKKFRVLKKLGKHYPHHNWEAKEGGLMKRVRKFLDRFF